MVMMMKKRGAIAYRAMLALTVSTAVSLVGGANWTITDDLSASDFLTEFTWYNETDPSNGLVLYQSFADAKANNITYVDGDSFYMRVDTTEEQLAGRRSARITSNKSYSDGVYVLNVTHIPTGCAVWPAFWTVTDQYNEGVWPTGGEIDIMENANDQYTSNLATLHTKSDCQISSKIANQTGTVISTTCESPGSTDNQGCQTEMNGTSVANMGSAFNNEKTGGLYAMERAMGSDGSGISVWYFAAGSEPSDLKAGSQSVDPSGWGNPGATFNIANECNSDFGPHNIVLNIDLCGDWAANTYNVSGCSATYPSCSYQVGYNGSSFSEAYWQVSGLRVFSTGGGDANNANSPGRTTTSSSSSSSSSAAKRVVQSVSSSALPATLLLLGLAIGVLL